MATSICRSRFTTCSGWYFLPRPICSPCPVSLFSTGTFQAGHSNPTRKISQYVHDGWGQDKGFIGGRIYAICQSADGYLWIGTERGLVRFDGSNFILIQRPLPDSPVIGPVRGLVTDASGNLWFGLEGPRMLLYHDGKFEDPYTRFDLQGITFTAAASDDKGRVILSGLGDRTFRYEGGRLETIVSAE